MSTVLRRTKSRFFAKDKARDPATLASVAAFTAWRLGLATIKQMRSAHFEIEASPQYFEVLGEYLRLEPRHLGLDGVAAHPSDVEAFARVVGLEGGLDAGSARARDLAERLVVERALAECAGNKTRAAPVLDVNYKRLLARIRELGLEEREEEPTKETP